MVKRAASSHGRSTSPLAQEDTKSPIPDVPEAGPSKLSDDPPSEGALPSKAKRRKKHTSKYKDEFQQVSNPKFVNVYRIPDMGYGGDVYYKADVSSSDTHLGGTDGSMQFIPSFEANAWYDILLALDTCEPFAKVIP